MTFATTTLCALLAADPALVERVPRGATPDPAERRVLEALAPKVYELEAGYDASGHVVKLFLTNHAVNQKARKIAGERPGVGDADAPLLAGLTHLTAVCFEKQPVTEKGLAVLKGLPLTDARFHYMPAGIAPGFASVVAGKPLEVLHVKHNFSVKKIDLAALGGFPKCKYLVLDTAAAGPQCVEFLAKCPAVEVFELHRPRLTAEQFGELADRMPNVRWLEVKPDIGGAGALAHLERLPKLECLMLSQWKPGSLPYDGGLEHLARVKSLKYLSVPSGAAQDAERLRKARPDLKLCPKDGKFPAQRAADGTEFARLSPVAAR